MNDNEKICFIYGVAYGLAVSMKEKGEFKDLTNKELALTLIKEFVRGEKNELGTL